MSKNYLIINAGSSSLKFSLYDTPEIREIVNGYIEKIGKIDSFYTIKHNGEKIKKEKVIMNHEEAVETMLEELLANHFIDSINDIKGIGHRVLHGGEFYSESVLIDNEVLNNIKALTKLGPLHHPGEIAGIESMQKAMPSVPQVAVFDTAFHQTMPKENYLYALPYNWYEENGVRKYGFHGTSHKYITEVMQTNLSKKDVNLIICHIGSGASISCIKNGLCHNTTMGLTPLDGLIMGTRCGTIDSSIIEYICKERKLSVEEVTSILNTKSGLLGISGVNDFRDLTKLANDKDENAILAIQMLKKSIINFIAQYYVELDGKVDAIVFTAGVAENNPALRADIINALSNSMNIYVDNEINNNIASFKEKQSGIITTNNSKFKVVVMPTNEEFMILKDTWNITNEVKTKRYVK